MSATTVAAPASADRPRVQVWRLVLAGVAVIVLLAASFLLGRVTASTVGKQPPAAPATPAPVKAAPAAIPAGVHAGAGEYCPAHQPC